MIVKHDINELTKKGKKVRQKTNQKIDRWIEKV